MLVTVLLLFVLPPAVAYASDLYASGTCQRFVHNGATTSSTYIRNYNDANHPTDTGWTVSYIDPGGTTVNSSYCTCSPAHLGSSGGAYRYSKCVDTDALDNGGAYSCYTTRP